MVGGGGGEVSASLVVNGLKRVVAEFKAGAARKKNGRTGFIACYVCHVVLSDVSENNLSHLRRAAAPRRQQAKAHIPFPAATR